MALTNDQLEKLTRLKHLQSLATRTKALFDALDSEVVKSVDLTKDSTAASGYAASYTLSVNGTALSTKINIPKDFLVKGATLETVATADTPYAGAVPGDKYIDFVINTKADGDGSTETDTHIYLPVNDLVDVYTAGNGLNLSNGEFSVTIDSTNANGLSVGANGLAMATVTASTAGSGGTNGAMLATDKEKLDGISVQANRTTVTTEGSGAIELDGVSKAVVYIATDAEVSEMIDAALPAPTNP
jgi:hypothetical protein